MPPFSRTKLSVNLNKVALLRNSRMLDLPSVTRAAERCLAAGAHGITLHPRPDARHIRTSDVFAVAELLRDYPHAELNLEGNPLHNLMDLVRAVRPQQCTFVPDSVNQATSDHGWDLSGSLAQLQPLVQEAQDLGVRVSLFMDADPAAMAAAAASGAERVELYTEPWAAAFGRPNQAQVLAQMVSAARAAQAHGLVLNAGHDLNTHNLPTLLAAIAPVAEVSIGHALIADALERGYQGAVEAYLAAIDRA